MPATADLLLLYPQDSLKDQVCVWAKRHPDRWVQTSFERSLPAIRQTLRCADSAIVDATADPALAIDAFLQAASQMGPEAVALYTEVAHEGLELFVRVRGSLVLFGPLFVEQWEEFLDRWLHVDEVVPFGLGARGQRAAGLSANGQGRRQVIRLIDRVRPPIDWPKRDAI